MPFKSNKYEIVKRLINRFKLIMPAEPVPLQMLDGIQITTDVDNLLKTTKIATATLSVTGTGNLFLHTCPLDKRWRIVSATAFLASGNWTFSGMPVTDGTLTILAKSFGSTTSRVESFPEPLTLEPGWRIGINVDAYTATGNATMTIMYQEEDAY